MGIMVQRSNLHRTMNSSRKGKKQIAGQRRDGTFQGLVLALGPFTWATTQGSCLCLGTSMIQEETLAGMELEGVEGGGGGGGGDRGRERIEGGRLREGD